MERLTLSRNYRNICFGMMGIGLLSLIITYFGADDELHTRFWSNFLHNSVFFTGIALMALFFMAASITAWAGWYVVFKRVWEAFSLFLPVGLVLMLVVALGNYIGYHHLYHWADAESVANDKLLQGKAGFLNSNWYLIGTIIIGGLWYFLARKIRSLSLAEDEQGENSYDLHRKMRIYAAAALPIIGFTSAAMIWQWIMSIDPHWYSTLYAWYTGASWFVAMICLTILFILWLQSQGFYQNFNRDHLHDLGKLLFAFSIFWTYLWFSQYMLIWYGNVGEETGYFLIRIKEYPILFYGNLLVNFALPFLVLLRNDTKRKNGTMIFVAIAVFLGHWMDIFQLIKPGALHTAHELSHGHGAAEGAEHGGAVAGFVYPHILEIGTLIGFLGLFLFVVLTILAKAALEPAKDPYLQESLHHHV